MALGTRLRRRGLAAAIVMIVAACSGQGEQTADGEYFQQYLDWIAFGNPDTSAETRMFEVEQHYLSDCMAEAGFDYTPLRDPRQVSTERPNYFDSTFVKTYGFGIVKSRDDLTILDEETVNDQLFASLSSEAQLSYSNAMSGTDGVSGCRATAAADARTELGVDSVYNSFEEVSSRIGSDERVLDATATWSTCAADVGYEFSSLSSLVDALWAEYDALQSTSDLADFRAREMKIAAALLGCNQTWKAALDKVTEEYLLDALDTRNP